MCTWYVWKKYLVGGSFLLKDILIGHFRIQDLWNWVLLTSYCYPCWRENRTKSELKSEAQLKTLFQDRFHLSFLKKPQFFTLNLTKIFRLLSRLNKFSRLLFFFILFFSEFDLAICVPWKCASQDQLENETAIWETFLMAM